MRSAPIMDLDAEELRRFATECLELALSSGPNRAAELRKMAREMILLADTIDPPQSAQQHQDSR